MCVFVQANSHYAISPHHSLLCNNTKDPSRCKLAYLLRHFILKLILLPREPRDKHRENSFKKTWVVLQLVLHRGAGRAASLRRKQQLLSLGLSCLRDHAVLSGV